MRLAAYEDAIYQRDGDVLTVHRAFPLFMWGLASEVEELIVLGRLDPAQGRSHYVVPEGGEFAALPHYGSAGDARAVALALGGTLRRFWSVLGRVDTVWVNGPGPMALVLALLAVARRRRVVLGVRQNTLEYARTRFPGRRGPRLAFGLMEAAWRGLARFTAVTAVGPDIAGIYRASHRLHELTVSFVSEADIAPPREGGAGGATLLSVGRIDTEKNPLLLADVLAELGPPWRLQIVGEGPLEAELRARLAELGVADRADLLGYVPLDRGLFELYRGADLFLHVSWTEGLPQVLLEAFAARLPVVATDVGGVGAVARGAALLVPPGDAPAAATALRRLAGDLSLQRELTEAGVHRVRARTTEAERARLVAFIETESDSGWDRYRWLMPWTARAIGAVKGIVAEAADRAYGIRTNEQISQHELGYSTASDNLHYQASGWLTVPGMFSGWEPRPGPEDVLVDLGCGKGRVLVQVARRYPVRRVLGLEYAPALGACARDNLERTRRHHQAASFEVFTGDASTWPIPDDVTIVYLANPFVGDVLAGALERIIESWERRPRRLRLAYAAPLEHQRVLATGRFRELDRADARWMRWTGVDPEQFRRYEVIPASDA